MNATAILRPGDVFLDSRREGIRQLAPVHPMSLAQTPGIHIVFDPQSDIADRVETAIRLGGYTNVRLNRCRPIGTKMRHSKS